MTETISGFGHSNLVLDSEITKRKKQITNPPAGGQANLKFEKSMTETSSGFGHSNLVHRIYLEFGACVLPACR